MLNFVEIIKKEINVIRSRKTALTLILLYPILLVMILAVAFGEAGDVRVNLAVFIPQEIEFKEFTTSKMIETIAENRNVNVIQVKSSEEVVKAIRQRKAMLGFIVHEEKTPQGQLVSDLILDNSSLTASKILPAYAKTAIQWMGVEATSSIVQSLWSELSQVRGSIKAEVLKIDSYIEGLQETEARLKDLNQSVYAIDIEGLRTIVLRQKANLAGVGTSMQQFQADYTAFKSEIITTKSEVDEADAKLSVYESKIDSRLTEIRKINASLEEYRQKLAEIRAELTGPPELIAQLDEIQLKFDEIYNESKSAENELSQAKADIQLTRAMLAGMRQRLNEAEARLERGRQSMQGLGSTLDTTASDLDSVMVTLSGLSETVDEVKGLLKESLESKEVVEARLQESKTLLYGFSEHLERLTGYAPEFLAKPLWIYEQNLFEEITLLGVVAPIAVSLVLLLTCLLLTTSSVILERVQGVALRMRISPTSTITFLSGKVIGQMIFALFISTVILAYAFTKIELPFAVFGYELIGFGIPFTPVKFIDAVAAVLLISFSFICLGLFITNFVHRESSAILASLLIMVPMFFLSGLIVPLSFMPEFIRLFSSVMPLTAANSLLTEVLLRNNPLLAGWREIIILMAPAIVMLLFTSFKEQKKD